MLSLYSRRRFDIGWLDLTWALARCFWLKPASLHQTFKDPTYYTHYLLSVRSALDLLLSVLRLPEGSQVIISAITIKDIVSIVEAHGLVAVPLDLEFDTLTPSLESFEKVLSSQTKVLLLAPLFGARAQLGALIAAAKRRNIFIIEDLAQAYDGSLAGCSLESDAVLFSFGPIKSVTALGGALLKIKDAALYQRLLDLECSYPRLSAYYFLKRVLKFSALKFLSMPLIYKLFISILKLCGKNYDLFIAKLARGFVDGDILEKIRWRIPWPQLALLHRRLKRDNLLVIQKRAEFGREALGLLQDSTLAPGWQDASHTFWVFPICLENPQELLQELAAAGFDATRGASNLYLVPAPKNLPNSHATQAEALLSSILYLPVYPQLGLAALRRMFKIINKATFYQSSNKHDHDHMSVLNA